MNFRANPSLALSFAAFAALVSIAGPAAAANCPQGATCKCETVIQTDCTVGAGGKLTCTRSSVLNCTVVSGPGTGSTKTALAQPALARNFSFVRQ